MDTWTVAMVTSVRTSVADNDEVRAMKGGGVEEDDEASDDYGARVENDDEVSAEEDDSLVDKDEIVPPSNDVNVLAIGDFLEGDVEEPDEEVADMDAAFIEALGGNVALESFDMDTHRSLEWSSPLSEFESVRAEYSQLLSDVATPIRELQDTIVALVLFCTEVITGAHSEGDQSVQKVTTRAKRIRAKQRKRGVQTPESCEHIVRRLRAEAKYEVHEILHVIGLLIARKLNPMTRRFSRHWAMTDDGAVPTGNFGK
ncbi:unnamed protein product [Phytophthora fragariaefolia]|uniref:Unnamed protein product n=1 Tax=Phytophthora fragariaefolia TaxID=1490495 RepID=A0A9W7DB37_9STRA|nr:unnamed protein product [Phytophthora fragariaefolia]